jgi:hypothetical protein
MLNEEQQQAKDNIQNFIRNGKGVFGLIGAGGTGKTYLITSLPDVENYQFLAPTNKAVNILRQGLIKNGVIKPNVKTIDSFFNFKLQKDEYNQSVYSYRQPEPDKIARVIVVDEVSMLRNKHIELLLNLKKTVPLIFIGDDMQIPPVENEEEPYIDENGFRKSKAFLVMNEVFELKIQNRQANGSEMFNLISKFRTHMSSKININQIPKTRNNGVDILHMNQSSDEFKRFVRENECIAVTYKNFTGDLFNYIIGSQKTGEKKYNVNDINKGEKLMFNSVYMREDVTFYTSEMITVLDLGHEEVVIQIPFVETPIKANQPMARVIRENKTQSVVWLKNKGLSTPVAKKVYYLRDKFKRHLHKGDSQAAKNLKKLNTFYNDFKNGFANLKKPYAITSHKSQGSTYDTVIIPVYDFWLKNHQDINQLFYVAMSRASKRIVFVDGWCNFNKSNRRVIFTQEERYLIAGRQEWECANCFDELFDAKFDIDHVTPIEHGGTNELDNLQALCKTCHKMKTHEQTKQITIGVAISCGH